MGNMPDAQHCHEFVPLECKIEDSFFSGPLLKIFFFLFGLY